MSWLHTSTTEGWTFGMSMRYGREHVQFLSSSEDHPGALAHSLHGQMTRFTTRAD